MKAWKEWGPLCIFIFIFITCGIFLVVYAFADGWIINDQFAEPDEPPLTISKKLILTGIVIVLVLALSIGLSFMATGLIFLSLAILSHFKYKKTHVENAVEMKE